MYLLFCSPEILITYLSFHTRYLKIRICSINFNAAVLLHIPLFHLHLYISPSLLRDSLYLFLYSLARAVL